MSSGTDARARPAPVTLELEARQPFDGRGVFDFLAARAIPGVERAHIEGTEAHDEVLVYARTVAGDSGASAFEVRLVRDPRSPRNWLVAATIDAVHSHDVPAITVLIMRLFDLAADAPRIDAALSTDEALAPLVRERPGVRVPGAIDPAELVIRAIVGQQISVIAALGHLAKLAERAGSPFGPHFGSHIGGLSLLFPTPAQILEAVPHVGPGDELDPDRPLRLPRRQSNAVRAAAEALAGGGLDARDDPALLSRQLTALPGVGPWTAAYVALRVHGDPDSWMLGDVALVAGARAIRILPGTREGSKQAEQRALAARAERWAPWRSYASMHLWRAALATSPPTAPQPTAPQPEEAQHAAR